MESSKRIKRISASAGSGKTYWLVNQYLTLLQNSDTQQITGFSPCLKYQNKSGMEELVAITFTNAAAAEMRNRIIRRIKNVALGSEEDIIREQNFAESCMEEILANYGALNIRTIDSLLHMIVRASTLELGLNPDFNIIFEEKKIFEPLLNELFEEARINPELRKTLTQAYAFIIEDGNFKGFLSKGKFQKRILKVLDEVLLGKFENLTQPEALPGIISSLQKNAAEKAAKLLNALANFTPDKRFFNVLNKAVNAEFSKSISKYFTEPDLFSWYEYGKAPNKLIENLYANCKVAVKNYYDGQECLRRSNHVLPVIDISRIIAKRFKQHEETIKDLPSCLLPVYASQIMKEGSGVSDAICKLGTRLMHFLVDEFQDTSTEQWNVLKNLAQEALSAEGSLGIVGDIKQSIYGFRGGDPELFINLEKEKELICLSDIDSSSLSINYRSFKEIVDFNNQLFGGLGDSEKAFKVIRALLPKTVSNDHALDISRKLSAIFTDCAQESDSGYQDRGKLGRLLVTGESTEEIWQKSLDEVCNLVQNDLLKRRPPKDICILCRSNENCLDIAEELVKRNIPVVTENSLLVSSHPLIIQAISFLEFLQNPKNNIAFWNLVTGSILASFPEWESLSAAVLNSWLAEQSDNDNENFIISLKFEQSFPEIWGKFFSPFFKNRFFISAYDVIQEWCELLEIERRFPEDRTFLRRFLEILYAAEQKSIMSVGDFLNYWEESGSAEKVPMPDGLDAVTVMTVHKAKGLESKVIVVPKTNFSVRLANDPVVMELGGSRIPVFKNNRHSGEIYLRQVEAQALETINILYVAFTRAREELYYVVNVKQKENGQKDKSVLELLEENLSFPIEEIKIARNENTGACPAQINEEITAISNLPLNIQPRRKPRLNIFRAHPHIENLTTLERGNFMHACLERLNFSNSPVEAAKIAFNSVLRNAHFAIPEKEKKELLENLVWCVNLAPIRNLISKGFSEQTIVTEDGRFLRPDIIAPIGDGAVVMDYKTGSPAKNHLDQVREYMEILKRSGVFAGEIKGLIVYMDKRQFLPVSSSGLASLSFTLPAWIQ